MTLTARQSELLKAVYSCIHSTGIPPTVAQLSQMLGCGSKGGVRSGLIALERKGMLVLRPKIARGVTLTTQGKEHVQSNCLSSIAGDAPAL